jgi:hypothetical protein
MTGIYVRVERNGRSLDLELDELTDEELMHFGRRQLERGLDGWPWVQALAVWIRDNVRDGVARETTWSDSSRN